VLAVDGFASEKDAPEEREETQNWCKDGVKRSTGHTHRQRTTPPTHTHESRVLAVGGLAREKRAPEDKK